MFKKQPLFVYRETLRKFDLTYRHILNYLNLAIRNHLPERPFPNFSIERQ
jgi:hypothetical protein